MPVSHIGLTVSHLPTSCSFFLSALQPLGYRFIGQWGNQIGLGAGEADFFLTQETPGMKAGAAHIAFSAPSRTVVRDFYTNALRAGGRPHGSPASRNDGEELFNAAVLDMDGNSVEVVYHEDDTADHSASFTSQSRVLTWNKDVAASLGDNKSVVSMASIASTAKKALATANSSPSRSKAPSVAHSSVSKASTKSRSEAPTVQRSFTLPVIGTQSSNEKLEISRKTLVGTILGAAAGAAVAYAMCKSEEDSARAEEAAYHAVQNSSRQLQASYPQLLEAPPSCSQSMRSMRNAIDEESFYAIPRPMRAIEAPPPLAPSGYQHPSYATVVAPSQQPEYVAKASRSRVSVPRSISIPNDRPRSQAMPSFNPALAPEYIQSDHKSSISRSMSHHSKARSSRSGHSSSSSQSHHRSSSHAATPELEPLYETVQRSTSVLGRNPIVYNLKESDDVDTVVPSDSISCAGVPRRPHHSSKASPSHHPSSRRDDSRRDSESKSTHRRDSESKRSKREKKNKSKRHGDAIKTDPDAISEAGSESTVTQDKYRKASAGSVMSLPIRGFTPSMIQGSGRAVASYYG